MLSNAYFDYFLAKFRFDTAENEPAKICKICEILEHLAKTSRSPPKKTALLTPEAGAKRGTEPLAGDILLKF